MIFKKGDQVKYYGHQGVIVNFHKKLNDAKNILEAKFLIEEKEHCLLFDVEGYVLPFTKNTPNTERVKKNEAN